VKGFATARIVGPTPGKGAGASYDWQAGVLHDFVAPVAPRIGLFISIRTFLIGVGLILALLTGCAAFAGLLLNLFYMFGKWTSVNHACAALTILLTLARRNASSVGLYRLLPRNISAPPHLGSVAGGHICRPIITASAPT